MSQHSGNNIIRDGLVYAYSGKNNKGYSGTDFINMMDRSVDGSLENGLAGGNDFVFDGTDDYIDLTATPIRTDSTKRPLTIDVWFRADGLANSNVRPILSRNSGTIGLYYRRNTTEFSANQIGIYVLGSQLEISGSNASYYISDAVPGFQRYDWINVTYTMPSDPSTVEVWINGQSNGQQSFSNYKADGNSDIHWIGILQDIYPAFIHNGPIGDIKIYNRILSDTEVRHNFDTVKTRYI